MKKLLALTVVAAPLAACNPYYADQGVATGAVVGGATGAAIGGLATNSVEGAVAGGAIGAVGGAIVGSAASRTARCEWDPFYGREVCYRY